ncbi:hypothetical protein KKC22_14100 [Myxococcota bacterium]|nr:hypothetical protein [Myxococcota bacterium]
MKQTIALWSCTWILLLGSPACEAPLELNPVCGDGVLAPVAGEQVETNFEACAAAGFFGGVSLTEDCLTLSERYCGNYRLLTMPASVKYPVLTNDADGALWIAGIVQGDFDGPTCPRKRLTWSTYDDDIDMGGGWRDHEDGYHHPGCDRAFFGRLGASRVPEDLHFPGGRTPPQTILSLGAAGFAMVRHHQDPEDLDFVVDWLSPQGALVHSETVRHHSGIGDPQLVRNGDDEFALVTFASDSLKGILWISRFSIAAPGLIQTSALPPIKHDPLPLYPEDSPDTALVQGAGHGAYRVVVNLQDRDARRYPFLITFEANAAEVDVTGLHVLDISHSPNLHLLERPADDGTVELVWSQHMEGFLELVVSRIEPDGTVVDSLRFPLPEDRYPQKIFRLSDGGWMIAGGMVYSREELTPPQTSCDPRPGQIGRMYMVATRLLPDGTVVGTDTFTSPAFDFLDPIEPNASSVACDIQHVRYALDGDALLIAGVYDRSAFFCAAAEPAATYLDEPVHTCGVYLVRLEPR